MAFERFYSIIRPHRAASFKTVKRAKITITCITVFSCSYIPYFKIYQSNGKTCVPFQNLVYYWVSITVRGVLPFILLLVMNSAIISTLHKRSMDQGQLQGRTQGQTQGQDKNEVQNTKMKLYERQVYVTLLLLTFSFLILTMPFYVWTFLRNFYKNDSPHYHAELGFYKPSALLQSIPIASSISFFMSYQGKNLEQI